MSNLKTVTSALTAAVLVTSIGLAWAQTDEQTQPTDPMAAATASPTSEQTPADPNALPADTTVQMPADDPARATPPVDTTAPLPADTTTPSTTDRSYNSTNTPAATMDTTAPNSTYEPAPRADRN
jgi:hypothetical protein